MRYYAKCVDMKGAEVTLIAKQDNEEAARKYLHEKYKLMKILEISTKPIVDESIKGYWPTCSSSTKAGRGNPSRVSGRKVNQT